MNKRLFLFAAVGWAYWWTTFCGQAGITRYVNLNNLSPAPPYTTWGTAATRIQDAVDVASAGDAVIVTNGTYASGGRAVYGAMTNRVAVDRAIVVQSVNGPGVTSIQGASALRCAYLASGALLNGFTLTGGGTLSSGDYNREMSGGGVWCESTGAVVTNCTITSCTTGLSGGGAGGGAYGGTLNYCTLTSNTTWQGGAGGGAYGSTLNHCTLSNNSANNGGDGGGASGCILNYCTLSGNLAGGWGGGAAGGTLNNCQLYNNQANAFGGGAVNGTLNNCTLANNSAASGAGAAFSVLNNCALYSNQSTSGQSNSGGGGAYGGSLTNCDIYNNSASRSGGGTYSATLEGCQLDANTALRSGGGAYQGLLSRCTITRNSTGDTNVFTPGSGGGAYGASLINCTLDGNAAKVGGDGGGAAACSLTNCLLTANSAGSSGGGGASGGTLVNCTVVSNTAFANGGGVYSATVNNCIVFYNTAPGSPNYSGGVINYSCTAPMPTGGTGNISDAPLFISLIGNLRLQCGSPCINAGLNAYAPEATDLDGNPRIFGGIVDMGAFEYNPPFATVTLGNLAQTYDGTAKSVSLTTAPTGLVVSVTYGNVANGPTNAGVYPVIATINAPCYQGSTNGILVISEAALTVTASNQSKTYGQTVTFGSSSTAFTSSGLKNGETIGTVTLSVNNNGGAPTAPVSGSPYTITPGAATGGTFSPGNYSITYAPGLLTVNPARLTVTATNRTKTYGQTVSFGSGSTAFTSSGLQNGETIGTVTLSVNNNGGAPTAPVSGSPYTITPGAATGGTFSPGNYSITYAPGLLTVNPARLTVTATNRTKTYGQTVSFGSGSTAFTSSGLQNGETIGTVTLSVNNNGGAPTAPVSGSPYTITPSAPTGGTFLASNYTNSFVNGTLSVTPATLTITADNQSRPYGAANPSLTYRVTGFLNGETSGVLSGSPSLTTTATPSSGVGSYPIIATNGTLTAANYIFGFVNGTLSVTPAMTPANWAVRYDGPAHGHDEAAAVALDNAGNVYVTGLSYGITGNADYATVKYSTNGQMVWEARYDNRGGDGATAIAVDGSGSVYVTGYSEGTGSLYDYATIKYSANGQPLWVARYNGPGNGYDVAQAIGLDAGTNVYVTGYSYGTTNFDFATIKYDPNGNQLWVARYDGPAHGDDNAVALAVDAAGHVLVTGCSATTHGGQAYATVKYDDSGRQLWVARYEGPATRSDDRATALAADSAGNVYVTGYSYAEPSSYDYATIKYASDGTQLWLARYNGPGNYDDTAAALALDASGNVLVAGASYGSGGSADFATVKYDRNGNQVWVARYDGPAGGYDAATTVAVDGTGGVYVAGTSTVSSNGSDCVTIRYDSNGAGTWTNRYSGGIVPAENSAAALAVDLIGTAYITGWSVGPGTAEDFVTLRYVGADGTSSNTAPMIIDQPRDQSVYVGGNVTFSVGAVGTAPLAYQWLFHNGPILGATTSTFTDANVQVADGGSYSVVVTNALGSVTSSQAILTVRPAPLPIVSEPPSVTVNQGGGTSFTVSVAGKGAYNGLFYATSGVAAESSGFFALAMTAKGHYSAKIRLARRAYSWSGAFDATGRALKSLPKSGRGPLQAAMWLDLKAKDILGTIDGGDWQAQLSAHQAPFSSAGANCPLAGKYTLQVLSDSENKLLPQGAGYATALVDKAGKVTMIGSLADGTPISQTASLSAEGAWPLYASLYQGQGSVLSWITFTNEPNTDLRGALSWIKPALTRAQYYPAGFTNVLMALGSGYEAAGPGTSLLNWTAGSIALAGGGLENTVRRPVALDSNRRLLAAGAGPVSISPATGGFQGTLLLPQAGGRVRIRGVLLQKANSGSGYFLDANRSGSVVIERQ